MATASYADLAQNIQEAFGKFNACFSEPILLPNKQSVTISFSYNDGIKHLQKLHESFVSISDCGAINFPDSSRFVYENQMETACDVFKCIINQEHYSNLLNNVIKKESDAQLQHICIQGATKVGKTMVLVLLYNFILIRNKIFEDCNLLNNENIYLCPLLSTPPRDTIKVDLFYDHAHFIKYFSPYLTLNISYSNGKNFNMSLCDFVNTQKQKIKANLKTVVDNLKNSKFRSDNNIEMKKLDLKFIDNNLELFEILKSKNSANKMTQFGKIFHLAGMGNAWFSDEFHWGAGEGMNYEKNLISTNTIGEKSIGIIVGISATLKAYENSKNALTVLMHMPENKTYTGFPYFNGELLIDESRLILPDVYSFYDLSIKANIPFLVNIDGEAFRNKEKYETMWLRLHDRDHKPIYISPHALNSAINNDIIAKIGNGKDKKYEITNEIFKDWFIPENIDEDGYITNFTMGQDLASFGLGYDDHKKYKELVIESLAKFAVYCFTNDTNNQRKQDGSGILIRMKSIECCKELEGISDNDEDNELIAESAISLESFFEQNEYKILGNKIKVIAINSEIDADTNDIGKYVASQLRDSKYYILLVTGRCRMSERVPRNVQWAIEYSKMHIIDHESLMQGTVGRMTGVDRGKTMIVLQQNPATYLRILTYSKDRSMDCKVKNANIIKCIDADEVTIEFGLLLSWLQKFNKSIYEIIKNEYEGLKLAFKHLSEDMNFEIPIGPRGRPEWKLKNVARHTIMSTILENNEIRTIIEEYIRCNNLKPELTRDNIKLLMRDVVIENGKDLGCTYGTIKLYPENKKSEEVITIQRRDESDGSPMKMGGQSIIKTNKIKALVFTRTIPTDSYGNVIDKCEENLKYAYLEPIAIKLKLIVNYAKANTTKFVATKGVPKKIEER